MASAVTGSVAILDSSVKIRGFGTTLIFGEHNLFPGVRAYSSDADGLAAMIADGFTVNHPIYLEAQNYIGQEAKDPTFKVGRSNTTNAESVALRVLSAVAGSLLHVAISAGAAAAAEVTRTIPGGSSVNAEATALGALVDAVAGVSVAVTTDTITVTPTVAAVPLRIRAYSSNIGLTDNTPAAGYAEDLAAAQAADPDWYRLICVSKSAAAIGACSAFAEANGKIYFAQSADSACYDSSSTTDILAVAQASGLHRTAIFITRDRDGALACGSMAIDSASTPGTSTIACQGVALARVDSFSATESNAIVAKNGISYETDLGSVNMTTGSTAVSGRHIDVTTIADYVVYMSRVSLIALLRRSKKIPWTATGRGQVDAEIRGVLMAREAEGGIVAAGDAEGWTTYVPTKAEAGATNVGNRLLPDVQLDFTVTGAIQRVTFRATLRI